ncbi:MAG TPA: DUF4105 domain-containing protein [Gemmatimonadaceae bacterium]|nr:DUF4105 domain-containing protein [Gemmatimonadaceae bacterium]
MRSQTLIRAVAALIAASSSGGAQVADSASVPGSELTVYLMTMGQGDMVWEAYGHNAIGIRDNSTGRDIVYNWGLFAFEEGFIGKFLRGELLYWMGGQDAASTLADYRASNRTVEVQELNLSPPQRIALRDFIQFNLKEENKYYRYDYFRDNCSTRVRDALNGVIGGALKTATDSLMTGTSYRWHALRLMAEDRLAVVGIDIGLGRPTDREISAWEEMFIPMKVRDRVRELRVPDETGALVPFVLSERTLYLAQRAPERSSPPLLVIPLGLIGLALGGGLFLLWRQGKRAAMPLAIGITVLLSVFGLVLLYLRFLTPHLAAYQNTNVFAYNPLWLVVLLAMAVGSRSMQGRRVVFWLATIVGALTAFGLIAPVLPGLRQGSFAVIALVAPAALVAAWMFRERAKPDASRVAPVTADA